MTIQQALELAAERLVADEHLRDTARRDAELLLMHAASLKRTDLIAYPQRELAPLQSAALETAIARRLRHEPVQYITGAQEFYGLPLKVSAAVLMSSLATPARCPVLPGSFQSLVPLHTSPVPGACTTGAQCLTPRVPSARTTGARSQLAGPD